MILLLISKKNKYIYSIFFLLHQIDSCSIFVIFLNPCPDSLEWVRKENRSA